MSIKLLETDKGHFYKTPIGEFPSVTTILKIGGGNKSGALLGWVAKLNAEYYEKLLRDISEGVRKIKWDDIDPIIKEGKALHRKKKDDTADQGTRLHKAIETYLEFKTATTDPLIVDQFNEFLKWEKEIGLVSEKSEMKIYHTAGFAGTMDIVGTIKGKRYVIDIKTSSAVYPEWVLQIGAYRAAYQQMTAEDVEGGAILRIGRDGVLQFKEYTVDELELGYSKFLCLLKYYQLENGGKDATKS